MSEPKLNIKEETSAKKTRSPPKRAKVEQSVPRKKKLKTDAEKTAEKAQHLRFGKVELTPDELSRLSKAQKREMYAAHAARSAVHREVDQYEDDNVGTQALSEGEKAAGDVRDISKSRYARKLKKKAKMQGKKGTKTAKSSASEPTAPQDAGTSGTGEGGSNWLSRWKQRQEIHKSYYAAARSGTAAQTAGGKAASNGASAARSGVEQAVEKGKTTVSTAVKGLMNAAKGNAHVLVMVMLDEWPPRPAVAFPCQQAGTGTDLEQDGIQRYFEHWLLSAKNGSGRLLPAFGFARVAAHGLSPANVQQQSQPVYQSCQRKRSGLCRRSGGLAHPAG